MKSAGCILVVEDSLTQARQLEAILKQLGYSISIAYNGREAFDLLKIQKTAVVVADILMPEMDGYQLCKLIKTDDKFRNIPVILLTQLSDPKEIIRGLECGADDFIVKPYNEELLLARIKAVLALKLKQDFDTKKICILVVEDSLTQAEQLRYLLEDNGYTVATATNGKEGLELAKEIHPTIIISDILMPVMDGYEFAYEVKHDKGLQKTPIILITSLMDRKEIARRASVVADGYFTKPYDDKYLLSKIESLISTQGHVDNIKERDGLDVTFAGERYTITAGRRQILNFLLSTYENAVQQNHDLILMQRELQMVNEQLEEKVLERTLQLQTSEENFRALAENANDAIAICTGSDGTLVYANRQYADVLGYTIDELCGTTLKDIIKPEVFQDIIEQYRKILKGKIQPEYYKEYAVVRKDGGTVPVEATVSKTVWQGQAAVTIILRDITERKRIEGEFIKASKLESLGILAGGIAHDFNNILTGILGNISLARMLVSPEDKIHKILTDVEKASSRAKDLTQQLLTFAKGGAPVKKTVSIAELIRDSVGFALRGSNVKCEFSIPDNLFLSEIDKGQMGQVFQNLIINAKEAMPGGGVVKVAAGNINIGVADNIPVKEGEYIKITIKDTGVGIPKEYLAKIFDPYFTTKETGSGLGLATVYSIIKNHDGYIAVESEVGTGTTFYIYLPASPNKIPAGKEVEEKPVFGNGRILIMDDEELVRDVAGSMLTKLGYGVALARDCHEAIELYKKARDAEQPFNVVILDLTIPGGMGGREVIKKLLEIDPQVKAIVSSGYSDDAAMSDFRRYGFAAVIKKPYKITELSKTVHQVIKGKHD